MMIMRALGLWVILCISSAVAFAAQLKNITVSKQVDKISLYFTIDGSFTHKIFILTNPNRVVLDLNYTSLAVNLNQLGLINPLVKKIRSGLPDAKTLRLVLDVNQKVQVSSSPWRSKGAFNGIRVDLLHGKNKMAAINIKPQVNNNSKIKPKLVTVRPSRHPAYRAVSPTHGNVLHDGRSHPPAFAGVVMTGKQLPKIKPSQQIKTTTKAWSTTQIQPITTHNVPIKVSHSPSNRYSRDVVVVLDAGHGGKDPGAKGPSHSQEKNVVLAITLKLKRLIDQQPGMHAVLTRSGDYYVGLRNRLDIARKYNGDVFVSIHADAFNNPHSNGASVFALSQSGATSEAARWIAEKENYSELGGVNLGNLDDTNGVVRSVLIDLSQTATINSGLQMGSRVLGQLGGFTTLHNNKVEQARFMVLKSPDTPSILVETGFISNPREERNLTGSAYQARLSQAIFQGIKGYFWDNPPHGTRLEAMATNGRGNG